MDPHIKTCYICSKVIGYRKMYVDDHHFCSPLCIDKYIKNSNGIHMKCCKCNKLFMKNYLGSHVIDIHGSIHVHCSIKCQFKK